MFAGTWFGLAALVLCSLAFILLLAWEAFVDRHPFHADGTRREFGSPRRFASTTTKARGTRTPETATTEECNSSSLRGLRLADESDLIAHLRENSSTAPTSSIGATEDRGASGEQREGAA